MDTNDRTESDNLRAEWEAALGHKLTLTEFEELTDNLRFFFDLLHSWQIRSESRDCAGDDIGCDSDLGDRLEPQFRA